MSVLFCDLVGFTAASEAADPEDVRARIRPYHARLRSEIEAYGGTVEKFVGDAVMAVFGAPVAHEDDSERAVRAGLAILDAIAELNEADSELELQVRVGINTGEAVVALGARPEQGEGIVTGDVVNTASRIQGAAPVGGVAIGDQTYRATSRVFEYEPLAPVVVKGKSEPVTLWRARAARSRFGTDITRRYTTPLVGRELEKPLLIGTFERAAQQRSVQLVTIVGEPGVGKSRLVAELFAYLATKPELTRWRQGRCLPYGDGITFWALGEIVKAHAGIFESDSPKTASTKLEAVLPEDEERPWLLVRLLPLLGIDPTTSAPREESFAAWRRFLEGIATGPTVLVFEDLHWGDQALLDFLTHLAEWAEGVPLLLLCTARPELYERSPGWAGGMRNATTINLAPLSKVETAELVSALLIRSVTAEVEQAILERSGGNPLYAEEFVRLIADRGLDHEADDLAFPETVQALIAARLDTLPVDRKSLLQDAAVLGKVFWAGALAEIGEREPVEVERTLHELSRKELVRPSRTSSMEGEAEYSFWHGLVRDIAYAQIPRAEKVRRHRAAARWIETKAGGRVEDLAELLAHHYLAALDSAEASGDAAAAAEISNPVRRFLVLAGERALALDAVQAEARLARALELCPPGQAERPEILLRWATAANQSSHDVEAAVAAAEEAYAAFEGLGDDEGAARALMVLSGISHRAGDGRFLTVAAQAVSLLEQSSPGPALVDAYAQLTRAYFLTGAHPEAIAAGDRALDLARRLGLPEPATVLAYRGATRADLGEREGIAEMERAIDLLVEEGASLDAMSTMNNLALPRHAIGGPEAALSAFESAIDFGRRRGLGYTTWTEDGLPLVMVELGRTDEAIEIARRIAPLRYGADLLESQMAEAVVRSERGEPTTLDVDVAVEEARATGSSDQIVLGLAAAARALMATRPRDAAGLLNELERFAGAHENPYYARVLPWMTRTALAIGDAELAARLADGVKPLYPLHEHTLCTARAQLSEADGEPEEAAQLYAEAAGRWLEFGNVPERAYALLGHGRCLVALGRPGAEQPLTEARDLFASMGYKPALAETEALLAQPTAAASS